MNACNIENEAKISETKSYEKIAFHLGEVGNISIHMEGRILRLEYTTNGHPETIFTTPFQLVAAIKYQLDKAKNPLESLPDDHTSRKTLL